MKLQCKEIANGFMATISYSQQKTNITQVNNSNIKVGEKVGENISVNQKNILKLLSSNPNLTATEIAKKIGISIRKTEQNIKKLREIQKLVRIGPTKGGYWQLLE